jgi:hypothetical protein
MYLADRNLPGIWRLKDGSLSLLFKGAKQFKTPLNAIRCVAMSQQDKLLAGDTATRDIFRIDDQGQPVSLTRIATATAATPAAPAAGKPSTSPLGPIGMPMDIAVAANGDLFVSDLELHRIVKVPKDGGEPKEFAAIAAPRGLFCDKSDTLWVISGRKLVKIAPSGEKTTVVGDGKFEFPHTVAVAGDGTAYVCDGYAQAIWKVAAGSEPVKLASGSPLVSPVGMRLAGDRLFVVDPQARAVFQVTLDGKTSVLWQAAAAK